MAGELREMKTERNLERRETEFRMPKIPILYGSPSDLSITSPESLIEQLREAGRLRVEQLPQRCILTFEYTEARDILIQMGYEVEEVNLRSLFFKDAYKFKHSGVPICLFQLGIGAPLAGAEFDSLLALGVDYSILVGGVGVLNLEIPRWAIIVPEKAIRDEGTSYHYEEPSPYTFPSRMLTRLVKETLNERALKFFEGAVWTTDAFYRETFRKREAFIRGGAICIDMEASALFSIARFRRRDLAALFYAGDYVGEERWNLRIERDHEEKRRRTMRLLMEVSLETLSKI